MLLERLDRLLGIQERSAKAQEQLIELAEKDEAINHIEVPMLCPHCGAIDPEIRSEIKGTGKLSEVALIAVCKVCGKEIIGIANTWQLFDSREAALEYQERRVNDDQH